MMNYHRVNSTPIFLDFREKAGLGNNPSFIDKYPSLTVTVTISVSHMATNSSAAVNLFAAKRNAIARWETLSTQFVGASSDIVAAAGEIARTGLGALDALHVACAIAGGCDYCITVDKRMLNYQDRRVIICNPMEFLNQHFKML
ncbi:MAG: PIN domain-containing protein [Verrucomicrobiales bacterium]|jgi:predicted nucleic acid-binding protein|nr:PIN domain-containing protein [Verrucomicrobiales bacterium]